MGRLWLLLLMLCAAFLSGCATTQNNVTVLVTGLGSTVEEARRAAFRDAIQLANGSLNLSERRVINDKLFEDDVSYARGVIDSFNEVSRTLDPKDKQYRIQMNVTVSPRAIQKRLLAAQDSKNVSGNEIGRQIDIAQQQIRSEIDRYMAARRLFEHLTRGMAATLFDISTGQVETVRSGPSVSSHVTVSFAINPKVLQSLCAAAKEYHATRTTGVPENFRKNLSLLTIQHAYDCSTLAEVEPVHIMSIAQDLDALGICLNLEDGSGQRLNRIFYNNRLVRNQLSYSGRYIHSGAYLLQGYTRSNVYYPIAVFLVRKAWGNDEKIRLELPTLPPPVLQRLAKITAVLSNDEGCLGPKPKATSILGLKLSGQPGSIIVEDVVDNSPAKRARFMIGDQILNINYSSVSHLSVQHVADRLAGRPRSSVRVEVFRKKLNVRRILLISIP